jgi:hypothetical protein
MTKLKTGHLATELAKKKNNTVNIITLKHNHSGEIV